MCWNAEVSLNTFLFSFFTLCFVYYNNEYTQYKIPFFENKWLYIFIILTFSMQLIEFFIWKNLKNSYNSFFTKMAFILVYLQPIASLMLLSNSTLRNFLLFPYIILGISHITNIIFNNKIHTTVSKQGHLVWNYNMKISGTKFNNPFFIYWLFLLLFSFFYEGKWEFVLFGLITVFIFIYKEFKSSGSTWCWFVNSIGIYILIYILFYLPFYEKKKINN